MMQALAAYNGQLAVGITAEAALAKKQHALCEVVDAAGWERQLAEAQPAPRALLRSEAEAGARAFLAAVRQAPHAWSQQLS